MKRRWLRRGGALLIVATLLFSVLTGTTRTVSTVKALSNGNSFVIGHLRYTLINDSAVSVSNDTFSSSSLNIPSSVSYEGKDYDVCAIGDFAFVVYTEIESINIPSSITSIGQFAFRGCTRLTTITIPCGFDKSRFAETGVNVNGDGFSCGEVTDGVFHYSHTWTRRVVTPATCTTDGEAILECTCENCCKKNGDEAFVSSENVTIPATGHKLINKIEKATLTKNGKIYNQCSVCGDVIGGVTTLFYPKSIRLGTTSYTYDGKVKTPSIKAVDSNGKVISASNYTVSYASGRAKVGKYFVKIIFRGNYTGSKTLTFSINPKATSIASIKGLKKAMKVKWKKVSGITGYQIQYGTSSKFKKAKTVNVKGYKVTSKTIKKLSAKKKYYVESENLQRKVCKHMVKGENN